MAGHIDIGDIVYGGHSFLAVILFVGVIVGIAVGLAVNAMAVRRTLHAGPDD
jgi:hypothetical protein